MMSAIIPTAHHISNMALGDKKQNIAQKMIGGVGNMVKNVGQALPVLGKETMNSAGRTMQNMMSSFKGKPKPPSQQKVGYMTQKRQALQDIDKQMQ